MPLQNKPAFYYEPATKAIKTLAPGREGKCLHYNGITDNVVMYNCNSDWSNQRWWMDDRSRLRTDWNTDKCLGRDANQGNNVKQFDCRDSDHQGLIVPNHFFYPGGVPVKFGGLCMVLQSDDVLASSCNVHSPWQYFYYEASTSSIKSKAAGYENKCLHYNGVTKNVVMYDCNSAWSNQQWWMDDRNRFYG